MHGLRQTKVDHLGNGLVAVGGKQNIRRLQIAMNDPFQMRMLHRVANGREQLQAFLE